MRSLKHSPIALILCAGLGEKWNGYLGIPKQLIQFGGEAILVRTVRLLRKAGTKRVIIATHDPRLELAGCEIYKPSKRQWTVETLLSTRSVWGRDTVVLLGDVFYSRQALRTILGYNGDFMIFGRNSASRVSGKPWREIFGLKFKECMHASLGDQLERLIQAADSHGKRGILWDLHDSLSGLPKDRPWRSDQAIFTKIYDETEDFDCPWDYERVKGRYAYFASENPVARRGAYYWLMYIRPILSKIKRIIKNI